DGEDHRRAHRFGRAAAALRHGADGSHHGRRFGELRHDRRRRDRRAARADRLCRPAGDRTDGAAKAARRLPARGALARKGRDRHDRRPAPAAREAPSPAVPHVAGAGRSDGVTALAELVRVSGQVAATPSRLAKIRALADFLRPLAREEIEIALPYLSGDIRQGKLAVGYASLQAARAHAAGAASLTLQEVDQAFAALKQVKGKGAAERRSAVLRELFARALAMEQDFLVRLIVGELRQGALEGIMVEAVAAAAFLPAADVRRAVAYAGAIAPVAAAVLGGGAAALAQFSVQLMQPVLPMLAQPAADMPAALAALGTALVEWKLDGARVQVHKRGEGVRIYTRNLNDVTSRAPEIVSAVRSAAARELILDGEAIALRADGRPHPFQVTMSRFGSQQDPRAAERPLSVFFFDCLLRDGTVLFDHPTRERRAALSA